MSSADIVGVLVEVSDEEGNVVGRGWVIEERVDDGRATYTVMDIKQPVPDPPTIIAGEVVMPPPVSPRYWTTRREHLRRVD